MGYYSELNYIPFKTNLSKEDFNKALEEYRESLPCRDNGNFWYDFDVTPEGRVVITDDDLYAKHYADRELAIFFSKVIADGEHTSLTFEGEDGCRWGYAIEKDKVVELDYPEPLTDGGIPIGIYTANTKPKIDKLTLNYNILDDFIQDDIKGDLIFRPDSRFIQVLKTASRLISQSRGLLLYIDVPGYPIWEDLEFIGDTLRVEMPVCRIFSNSFVFRAYIRHTNIAIETEEVAFKIFE